MSSDQCLYESQSIKPGRKFIGRRGALRCWILVTFPLETILQINKHYKIQKIQKKHFKQQLYSSIAYRSWSPNRNIICFLFKNKNNKKIRRKIYLNYLVRKVNFGGGWRRGGGDGSCGSSGNRSCEDAWFLHDWVNLPLCKKMLVWVKKLMGAGTREVGNE